MQVRTVEWQYGVIRRAILSLRVVAVLVPVAIGSGIWTSRVESPTPTNANSSGSGLQIGNIGNDLQTGPGPNNDLVGREGWIGRRLGDVTTLGEEGRERDREREQSAPPDKAAPNDVVTLRLTRKQAEDLIQILRNAVTSSDVAVEPKASVSGSSGTSAQGDSTAQTVDDVAGSKPLGQARALAVALPPPASASTTAAPSSRLSTATPLILTFAGATAIIVVLMVYSGILLIRAGAASGGAKLEFLGLKIDAKGSGIAAIACGSLVLLATFRPLIEAVVTLSQN